MSSSRDRLADAGETDATVPSQARATVSADAPPDVVSRGLVATAVALIRALRPKQWIKNCLVAAAPLAAGSIFEWPILLATIVAFLCMCAASSATYLINDFRDIEADRRHPVKRYRPMASGALSPTLALTAAVLLIVVALALAAWQAPALGFTVATYLVVSILYSLGLKYEPVLELGLLALGFLLRAIAGGVAADIPLSNWFLIVAAFGSLFMAAGKRHSELDRLRNASAQQETSRPVLAGYTLPFLRFVWGLAASVTIASYCLWTFEVADGADGVPWAFISIFPFVLAILSYARDIDRGAAEAPEDAVFADRTLAVSGLMWLVLFGLGALTT